MNSKKIKVFVISIPSSSRNQPLLEQLSKSSALSIQIFPAVMYPRPDEIVYPNVIKQKILYNRELSKGEIGSAISHQHIQFQAYKTEGVCVILEDDARISDITKFEKLVTSFCESMGDKNAVLSLLPWVSSRKFFPNKGESTNLIRLVGKPPLCVGYVITAKAMEEISTSNHDFAYLPDWPPSSTSFYVTLGGVISHGDLNTFSYIDKTGRNKTSRILGLKKFSCYAYLKNRSQFESFSEYFLYSIWSSITWRIDKLRVILMSKSLK
jgi:hypothetical protein